MILLFNSCNVVFVLCKPRMIECFIDSNALFWVLYKSFFDKIFAFFTDLLPALTAEVRVSLLNQAKCVFLVATMKRKRSCQHCIYYNSCGPDINLLLIPIFVEYLGGHISRSAARLKHELTRDHNLAQAEISQLYLVHFMVISLLV